MAVLFLKIQISKALINLLSKLGRFVDIGASRIGVLVVRSYSASLSLPHTSLFTAAAKSALSHLLPAAPGHPAPLKIHKVELS